MIKHLWLDLEDTIITPVVNGWFNTQLMNVEKIKRFITEFKPDFVHVFSFAIWNEHELLRFNEGTRPMIEKALEIQFSIVPTVDDDILPVCSKVMNLHGLTFIDMSDFWGKQEAFRLNMRHMFATTDQEIDVVLLDDAVFNEKFSWPDLHIQGQILNIDKMKD